MPPLPCFGQKAINLRAQGRSPKHDLFPSPNTPGQTYVRISGADEPRFHRYSLSHFRISICHFPQVPSVIPMGGRGDHRGQKTTIGV